MLPVSLADRLGQAARFVDQVVDTLDPVLGEKRRAARQRVGQFEAAKTTRLTNVKRSTQSGDGLIELAGKSLRERARWLDENHDVFIGIMDTLVNNIVGTGIGVEPQIKTPAGDLHEAMNDLVSALHEEWSERPEVTWMHDLGSMERAACLHWLRDGEALGQLVAGDAKFIDHGTEVPFSVELIEADFLPLDYNDAKRGIRQGIGKNAWGRPIAFWLYKVHPLDGVYQSSNDLKPVSADNIAFLRYSRRISQLRGNSIAASIINRLGDVKMYEDYERVAAQVAAALTVFISRDTNAECPAYLAEGAKTQPARAISPGMVLEGAPGEDPKVIQSSRPSNQLESFRKANLRAAAAGSNTGYSSISKDYDGSYSAQRQELVEQSVHYRVARTFFARRWSRPIYQRFVQTAMLSGRLDKYLREIDINTLTSALYSGVVMPWIDPQKEADALATQIGLSLTSRSQAIRERGGNPRRIAKQLQADESLFGPMPAKAAAPAPPAVDPTSTDPAADPAEPGAGADSLPPPPAPAARRPRKPNGHAHG